MDSPLGLSSGAADIFANTGGVMEAAVTITGAKPDWSFLEGVEVKVAVSPGWATRAGFWATSKTGRSTISWR